MDPFSLLLFGGLIAWMTQDDKKETPKKSKVEEIKVKNS